MAGTVQAQTVRYVDADSPNDGPGNDWGHAYHHLQNALGVAGAGDEIRVAQGTHRPDESTANPAGTDDQTAMFQLISGVTLEGGYAGYGAADPDERDVVAHQAILSGDLAGNDDPAEFPFGPSFGDNSYHVVTGSGTDVTAVLDGFTIIAGNADGPDLEGHKDGAGLYNVSGSPTLGDCTFNGNSAGGWFLEGDGGGMYNAGSSSPTLESCAFGGNFARYGGGISNHSDSHPELSLCDFDSNSALRGGGFFDDGTCDPQLVSCTFLLNTATYAGGGMFNWGSPTVDDCTFTENSAPSGGGMANMGNGQPVLIDCLFMENYPDYFTSSAVEEVALASKSLYSGWL